ncbi:TPA: GNAT family N-acetyltransferase [Campylobacter coli]|nr:GNAT family N-acetyltransferase [Campylobacter coli]
MNLFEEFEKNYFKGFKLSNWNESISILKEKFHKKKLSLESYDSNFFFYENNSHLLYYFINDTNKKNKLKPSFIKISIKHEKYLDDHLNFIHLHSFNVELECQEMCLKNKNIILHDFPFITQANIQDYEQIYNFFLKHFSKDFLFYFSKNDIKNKINQILIYKENGIIRGALIYTLTIKSAFLDFIAVDKNLHYKNVAFALLNTYFKKNFNTHLFKLFVSVHNLKALKFYQRAGFTLNTAKILYYKNF